ncbi:putative cation transporter [Streptomyces zinciresistens K42]|uniref:Putative cation transporter n=1 Tax=Streptomyces zinciresistens K42 TaxID=700597 RepID=G2GBS9_9ACTN|nr:cation diffusion facilitator family transporter [Streptomyces zinciresistens]EGX59033.1 putative cation transporter [Streptomyces zinciresistens K42]
MTNKHSEAHAPLAGHRHAGHHHGVQADADRRYLSAALVLITAFMAVEVTVGLLARSLALISDAGHMLTDAAAIVLALIAMRLAALPPRGGYTFGLKRAEIISALVNGVTLLLLAGYFVVEGVRRFVSPPEVNGLFVVVTGAIGIVVNVIATWLVSKANRGSLNVEGAFQHLLNDLYAFISTTVAGLVVWLTGWTRADAVAALIVAALMLKAGWGLVRASGRVFLESAPHGLDPESAGAELARLDGVVEVHDVHVWEITSGYVAASAHILVAPGTSRGAVQSAAQRLLHDRYEIAHATLQIERVPPVPGPHCADPHGRTYPGAALSWP